MAETISSTTENGLERSCGYSPQDWVKAAPYQSGLQRLEAHFIGHAFDVHRHDSYAIGYTMSGVQSFDYRSQRFDSKPGTAIVLYPDESHNGRAGALQGFRYRMLYLEPRLIQKALGHHATALPFVSAALSSDQRLLAALVPAFQEMERCVEPLQLDQTVLAIGDALLALDPSARGSRSSALKIKAVDIARQYLDENFERQVASSELEQQTGLDRYELSRQFKKRLGTSPYRYVTMRRLDQARAAINAGTSLAEAAADSGFADQSHMTRQFKSTFGLAPGRWRHLQRT